MPKTITSKNLTKTRKPSKKISKASHNPGTCQEREALDNRDLKSAKVHRHGAKQDSLNSQDLLKRQLKFKSNKAFQTKNTSEQKEISEQSDRKSIPCRPVGRPPALTSKTCQTCGHVFKK